MVVVDYLTERLSDHCPVQLRFGDKLTTVCIKHNFKFCDRQMQDEGFPNLLEYALKVPLTGTHLSIEFCAKESKEAFAIA